MALARYSTKCQQVEIDATVSGNQQFPHGHRRNVFTKPLLKEDMSGSGKGFFITLAISNAITCYQIIGVTDKAEKDEIVKAATELRNAGIQDGYTTEVSSCRYALMVDVKDKLYFVVPQEVLVSHMAESMQQVQDAVKNVIPSDIEGLVMHKVYLWEKLSLTNEMYVASTLDRKTAGLLIACSKGATSTEYLTEKNPDMIIKVSVNIFKGITDVDATKVTDSLALQAADREFPMEKIKKLYNFFCKCEGTLLEDGLDGTIQRANGITSSSLDPPTAPVMAEALQTITGLLNSVGHEKYCVLFKAEEIDMAALRQMGESDLKDIGSHVQWDPGILKLSNQIWESKPVKTRILLGNLGVKFTCPFHSMLIMVFIFPNGREQNAAFFRDQCWCGWNSLYVEEQGAILPDASTFYRHGSEVSSYPRGRGSFKGRGLSYIRGLMEIVTDYYD